MNTPEDTSYLSPSPPRLAGIYGAPVFAKLASSCSWLYDWVVVTEPATAWVRSPTHIAECLGRRSTVVFALMDSSSVLLASYR
jgi:hypothetical protein